MRKDIIFIIWIYSFVIYPLIGIAYDSENVHPLINEGASRPSTNLQMTLKNIGFSAGVDSLVSEKEIYKWFREGGTKEDVPDCRSKYHFHDPTKTFDTAGLSNAAINIACLNMNNESSLMWSQHQDNPWSWQKGREYYYQALTAVDKNVREQRFADTFRAVGQVMHLLADASVPEHTRNDIHIFPWLDKADKSFPQIGSWTYETWCKHHAKNLNTDATAQDYSITSTSVVSGLQPIFNLWDTTPLPITGNYIPVGLAEYSNYNFLSSDTIFKDYLYPINPAAMSGVLKIVAAEDGKNDIRVYFSSMASDNKPIEHLVSTGYLWSDLENISPYNMDKAKFNLDDNCYKDYAAILIPKAVSYSAGLLNYFFRGTLDISWPTSGVYSIADGSKTPYADAQGKPHQQFTMIKLALLNTTPNENVGDGILTAIARYKIIPNYAKDLSSYPPDAMTMKATEYSYSVSKDQPVANGAISSVYYNDFVFDFSTAPIPAGITDLTLQVVFKGTIGNESEYAIAVGMRDVSEPTHMTIWNLSDMYSIRYGSSTYSLYTFDQIKSKAAGDSNFMNFLDTDGDRSLNNELYLQPGPATYTISFWSGWQWSNPIYPVEIPAGGHIRMIALGDTGFNNGVKIEFDDHNKPSTIIDPFSVAVVQADQGGEYTPTSVRQFRKGYSAEKQMVVPIIQHFADGAVGCTPQQTICTYHDETAIEVSMTPITFKSVFE